MATSSATFGSGAGVPRDLSNHGAVRDLVSRQPANHSLLQPFYTDEAIYRLDVEKVLARTWHCVGHQSQLPKAGDYLTFACDRDSAIVIRGDDGRIRALANTCRHRGSRICSEPKGHAASLVCPYHAWSYKTDGTLRRVPKAPPEFDSSLYSLKELPLEVIEGLLFVSFVAEPWPLEEARRVFADSLGSSGFAQARVVHQEQFTLEANWKLALENQVECYHCAPAHVEFTKIHAQGKLGSEGSGALLSLHDAWARKNQADQELAFWSDNSLVEGAVSGSQDGQSVGPLMSPERRFDGRFRIAYLGVLNHFLAYADYGAIFKYTPRAVDRTDFTVTWLVKGDARDEVDFDLERLTWMWKVTAGADKRIVQENQIGVASHYYVPGPYVLPIEAKTLRLTQWYLDSLRNAVAYP